MLLSSVVMADRCSALVFCDKKIVKGRNPDRKKANAAAPV